MTKQLKLTYAKSTGFDPFFEGIGIGSVIVIPRESFSEGGFGEVYHAIQFDGVESPMKQVVKIFKDDKNEHGWRTISELQSAIIKERENAEKSGENFLNSHPGFIGFPQLIFEGKIEDRKVRGHVTVNLLELGCTSLDNVLPLGEGEGNNESRKEFLGRKAIERAVMAYQLVDCFDVLHRIHYIHADITPDNIMVSRTEPLCVLIDYDSGVVVKNSRDDNPITRGKLVGGWTAPEIQMEASKNDNGNISINHDMDLWSIAAAIHNLLYGFPHLFLAHMTGPAYQEYFNKYPNWPDIDVKDSSLFDSKSIQNYQIYRDKVFKGVDLGEEIIKEFRRTFTYGIFNSSCRTSIEVWVFLLRKEIDEASFSHIKVLQWTEILKNRCQNGFSVKEKTSGKKSGTGIKPTQERRLNEKNAFKQKKKAFQPTKDTASRIDVTMHPNEMKEYMEELLPDIINGRQELKMHEGFISKIAIRNGLDGAEFLQYFRRFITDYNESIKDNVISDLEYRGLILQAKMIKVDKEIVDELLKDYKRS